MIIDNGFQSLTIITKRSILDVAAVLDPPLDAVKNQTLSVTGLKCMHGVIYTLKMNSADNLVSKMCAGQAIKTQKRMYCVSHSEIISKFVINIWKLAHLT